MSQRLDFRRFNRGSPGMWSKNPHLNPDEVSEISAPLPALVDGEIRVDRETLAEMRGCPANQNGVQELGDKLARLICEWELGAIAGLEETAWWIRTAEHRTVAKWLELHGDAA